MKNSKRRGAVKVPNVKLRPAEVSRRSNNRKTSLPRVALREDDADQEEVDLTAGNRPFDGIVLCATGDLDKRTLFAHAQELGATRANDFTDQVTHLVADAPGSAKYRCAVERNLPILKVSWVEEAYQIWLNGDVVDLEQITNNHSLPIFSGVRLCVTGLDDVSMRSKIHTLLANENGVYLKSLDKTATHLLSCALEETPKIKWANDYNRTQSDIDKIHIVWDEWFWDCLEFRGRWDEREYEVTNARPSRKSLARVSKAADPNFSQIHLPTATLAQRSPLPQSVPTSSLLGDELPEFGQMHKPPDARLRIFQSIVQKRGYTLRSDGALQCTRDTDIGTRPVPTWSTSTVSKTQGRQDETRPKPKLQTLRIAANPEADSDSVLMRLSNHRAISFGCSSLSRPQFRQPFRRVVSSTSSIQAVIPQTSLLNDSSMTASTTQFFSGYKFRAFGEAKGPVLRDAIETCGGRWLAEDDEDEDADFLVVRLVSGGMFWRDESDEGERAKFRTECWIERCIFEERICPPEEHVVFTPLKINTPVEGSETLHVSLSGLDSAEMCWVKRLVRALGGNLSPTFSRCSTHLLCPSFRGAKYDKARAWGVSVVDMEWLLIMATTGKVPVPRDIGVVSDGEDPGAIDVDHDIDVEVNVKGTGKAREDQNGVSQESQSLTRWGITPSPKKSSIDTECLILDTDLRPSTITTDPDSIIPGKPKSVFPLVPPITGTPTNEVVASPPLLPLHHLSVTPKSRHRARRFSAGEIDQDKQTTFIPSSHSPSPLRASSKPGSVASRSPPISETRGLRTTITALLGKRGIESEGDGPTQKPQWRSSKRPRPPSRGTSDHLDHGCGPSPALSFISGNPLLSRLSTHDERDPNPEEEQPSLHVVYEDPAQRAEKRRLIALFEGGSAADGARRNNNSNAGNGKNQVPTQAQTAAKRKLRNTRCV